MSNEITTRTTTALDYNNREVIETIRKTIAPNATDAELAMFIELCKGTGLNPYKREVWFIKTKGYTNKFGQHIEGKAQIMTGINGFYAIANSHPQYDGIETDVERDENGKIIRAVAKAWRKDRRFPSVGVAEWSEYFPGTTEKRNSIWETKPSIMITKVAESIALRKAFPNELNGLYTQEEMPPEYSQPVNVTPKTESLTEGPKAMKAVMYRVTEAQFNDLGERGYELYEYLSENAKRQVNPEYWVSSKPLTKAKRYMVEWTDDCLIEPQKPKADPVDVLFDAIEQEGAEI